LEGFAKAWKALQKLGRLCNYLLIYSIIDIENNI
jgi:hypothetical protein